MKLFSIGTLALLLVATAAKAEPAPVRYRLSPVLENGTLKALAVDIDFEADADGLTTLRFASRFQNEKLPGRYAEGLTVTGGETVTPRPDGGADILAKPGAALHARYRVRSGFDAAPTTQTATQTKPIILPDWFYAAGELLFAYPEDQLDSLATFVWSGAPAGFGFASDLERLADRRGAVVDVLDSIVIGSPNLRLIEGQGGDAGLRIAVLGRFDHFDDPTFADAAFRVIRAERDFWGDDPSPFLITLAPLIPRVFEHYSGTGRTDAFALWAGTSLSAKEIYPLLAHEYFHTWNSDQLGEPAWDRSNAWLSEGFTDFYTKRILLRAGLFSLEDYAASWNEWLRAYGVSPARNATEAKIVAVYWQDRDVEEIAYKRGAMMAALFDIQLRRDGRHLDMVMRLMRAHKAGDPKSGLAPNFEAAFTTVLGRPVLPEIDRYEMRGETLTLPDDTFACLTLSTVTQPAFRVGFDADATAEKGAFTGVDPAGPAYAAGLRDGMKRLKREGGAMGDSSVELAYTVADAAGREQVIRYKPEGKASVTFQKLSIPVGLTQVERDACVRTLSGFYF